MTRMENQRRLNFFGPIFLSRPRESQSCWMTMNQAEACTLNSPAPAKHFSRMRLSALTWPVRGRILPFRIVCVFCWIVGNNNGQLPKRKEA